MGFNAERQNSPLHSAPVLWSRCTERIGYFFENALYKITLYLLTYYDYKCDNAGKPELETELYK